MLFGGANFVMFDIEYEKITVTIGVNCSHARVKEPLYTENIL